MRIASRSCALVRLVTQGSVRGASTCGGTSLVGWGVARFPTHHAHVRSRYLSNSKFLAARANTIRPWLQ